MILVEMLFPISGTCPDETHFRHLEKWVRSSRQSHVPDTKQIWEKMQCTFQILLASSFIRSQNEHFSSLSFFGPSFATYERFAMISLRCIFLCFFICKWRPSLMTCLYANSSIRRRIPSQLYILYPIFFLIFYLLSHGGLLK